MFKLGNVVKRAVACPADFRGFNLRKVAAIVAYLAVTAIFLGCDKDDEKGDYTIKYSPGTHISGDNYSQAKTEGKDVTLRDVTYTRGGYKQTGWSKKANGSSKDYSLNDTYTEDADIELFPFWKDENDPDDGNGKFNLPTNVKFTFIQQVGSSSVTKTAIKIGNDYYWKTTISVGYDEYYLKHNNGSWTEYYKNLVISPNWELEGTLNATQKDYKIHAQFLNFMADWYSEIKDATKGGKETIAGVSTDKYTLTSGGFTIVFNLDPITNLTFKVTSTSDNSSAEVTSWDKSVTSFGISDLP